MDKADQRQLLDAERIDRIVTRIAHEILERNRGSGRLALVGVLRGGEPVMRLLSTKLRAIEGVEIPFGTLDIGLYRDDLDRHDRPQLFRTEIGFNLDGRIAVLVDDVLFTGRTVRSAMDALMDLGRPAAIQLAVLIDRGHRELPIHADYVGRAFETDYDDKVLCKIGCPGEPDCALLVPHALNVGGRPKCD
ncbi:MAG: bifunctional pyr operon transcriptional regulator/uracil phosphoribosyltransferase PyrR [Candidatus Alcyoniella australis]|nr:bifunctional pyr operon transcriptional regulator/uracil phosphoribosyltransferase PyrR [Candidatus Alcyoniella australis]